MTPLYPLDEFGLPGCLQSDSTVDGGDSAAIWGTVEALGGARQPPSFYFYGITLQGELYLRRSPQARWDIPHTFTRDQFVPLLCAGIVRQRLEVVDIAICLHKQNLFLRAWNRLRNKDKAPVSRDWTLMHVWALELRYKYRNALWVRPLLCLLDLENMFGALLLKCQSTRVTRNHMLIGIVSYEVGRTPVSWLTHKLLNNYQNLTERWSAHCRAVGEYYTADMFRRKLGLKCYY